MAVEWKIRSNSFSQNVDLLAAALVKLSAAQMERGGAGGPVFNACANKWLVN